MLPVSTMINLLGQFLVTFHNRDQLQSVKALKKKNYNGNYLANSEKKENNKQQQQQQQNETMKKNG